MTGWPRDESPSPDLAGVRVVILAADGVAQAELAHLVDRLQLEQATVALVSLQVGRIWTALDDLTPGHDLTITHTVEAVAVSSVDALVVPSGMVSASRLRGNAAAVEFVAEFQSSGRPLAVRGDGVALLIDAQGVEGRRLSTVRRWWTGVRNAGGVPVDDPLVNDGAVISSAGPGDLELFWTTLRARIASSAGR